MSLTVVCWLWNGWRAGYQPMHVNMLERMLQEHLKIPHRFVCITDNPEGIRGETMEIWDYPQVETIKGKPNCYRRLRLFSDEAKEMFGPRVLSIDLDVLILSDITDLITDDDFKIVKGRAAPYNGSMWLHTTGTKTYLWDEFDPATSPAAARTLKNEVGKPYYGSDQAWMSYREPNAPTWSEEDGVYQYSSLTFLEPPPENARIVFFAGSHKPWDSRLKFACKPLFDLYRKNYEREHEDIAA